MAASQPLVSVVLPTFNREDSVTTAIESVLGQSYASLELIVVDDASTDGTEGVVRGIADARISYRRHENNRGASAARNRGLQAARGEFLAFQDSDDVWHGDKLQLQMERFAALPSEVGVIWCPYRRRRADGGFSVHPAVPQQAPRGDVHRDLLRANFIGTPTIVARRACYEVCGGFDEGLPRFQDWEWMIRVSRRFRVDHLDRPLVDAGPAGEGITCGHDAALVAAERRLLEKHEETFAAAGDEVLAYRWWHLAHVCFMHGAAREGREALRRAQRLGFRWDRALGGTLARVPPLYRAVYRLARARSG